MAKGFNPRARKQYPFPNPQDRGFSKNILRPQNVVKPQPPSPFTGKGSPGNPGHGLDIRGYKVYV